MLKLLASLVLLAVLAGCASLNSLPAEVSTYSDWPEGRRPSSYAIERLPSQAAHPEQAQLLADSARPALESAGFVRAADPGSADVVVQLGARVIQVERSPFDDPYWYGWRRPFGHPGRFRGPRWYPPWPRSALPIVERAVGVLIRDRRSGQVLYESSASSEGGWPPLEDTLPALYAAALQDFPRAAREPRRVMIPLGRPGP